MDRRDFLAAWIQALLLAIFPFLRGRPMEQSHAIAEAIVDKMPPGIAATEYGHWANYVTWSLVRSYDLRWRIGQNAEVLDQHLREMLRHTQFVPAEAGGVEPRPREGAPD